MYKLIIEDDEGKTTVVPLIRDEITIGRKEGNTIRLTERNVSRRHAKLVKSNGSVVIEDLQSHNGIKVNGDRIAGRAPVNEGDRIQIGDYQIALKVDKAATAPAGSPQVERGDEKTTPFVKEDHGELPTRATPVISAGAEPERPARLVVVSSNFARQEFILDKAAMVIGRTDENDIVVNHRSISRHHAKILREGGHYHVQDLQSANGVRVNGEEYGKVELRKGDHIDLGHVRMRFVGPGEDFVFDRDAKVVEVAGDKKGGSTVMIAAIAGVLLLVGGGFAIYKLTSGKGDEKKPDGPHRTAAELNMEIDKAKAAKDWDACLAACDELQSLESSLAATKRSECEDEKKAKKSYESYKKASSDGDNDRAVTAHEEIPKASVYYAMMDETWPMFRKGGIREHLGSAKAAAEAGKCDEARKHIEWILMLDEGNTDAQDLARKCGQPTAPPPAPTAHPAGGTHAPKPATGPKPEAPKVKETVAAAPKPVEPAAPPPAAPKPAEPAGGGADGEKLYNEAMQQYVQGNYSAASEISRKSIAAGYAKAWRVFGSSACFLKNHDDAVKAWNKLNQMDRQFIKYVCDRNQVKIP